MTKRREVHIIGGGTIAHVRPHLALAAPAYGYSAKEIEDLAIEAWEPDSKVILHLTRMACGDRFAPETNQDVANLVEDLVAHPETKVIFMPVALCDFEGSVIESGSRTPSGKNQPRLKTSNGSHTLEMTPANKVISKVRQERKDIFLVGFKTTAGQEDEDEQFKAGLDLLKKNSCNLVLANDVHTGLNMIITPEQARYCVTTDRTKALRTLVKMAHARSRNTFTRSTVLEGDHVDWNSDEVPSALREVINHCIRRGAYKKVGSSKSTVGHFAVNIGDGTFLTSRRKTDFNDLDSVGLVRVKAEGLDKVIAYGSKPSVGGQSQRIVFFEHPDADLIFHAHVPMKSGSNVPIRSQFEYECRSHECGQNTSSGLKKFGRIWAVMLENHGPNVVFPRDSDPKEVIQFIEQNFDLEQATDGIRRPTRKFGLAPSMEAHE